ncbi:MAG: hypothetical protein ABIR06_16585 [Cyclobacteriaceae bacterium]
MDTKTLATCLAVFLCVLFIPAIIGIVGGIVGVAGSLIGAVFSVIGAIFSGMFSIIGWMAGSLFHDFFQWRGSYTLFNWDFFTVAALVVLIVVITRSKKSRSA